MRAPTTPPTTPRPRPHGLSRLETALVVLEVGLAIGGVYGGVGLFARPDGSLIRLDPAFLEGSLFADYRAPGAVLLVAGGLLPLVVAAATLARKQWSAVGHLVVGTVAVGWIVIQLLMLGYIFFLQPLVLAWGLLILVLGTLNRRRLGHRA